MSYVKKRPEDYAPPTFDELLKEYEELTKSYTRQHGRKAAPIENTPEGYKRLYKNVKSIKSRNKRKKIEAEREQSYVERFGFGNDDADINGITAKDRRRYNAKFANCPHGAVVELDYLRRMTGLTLKQIFILQNETGKYPYPAVTEKAANKDQAYRDKEGIYI